MINIFKWLFIRVKMRSVQTLRGFSCCDFNFSLCTSTFMWYIHIHVWILIHSSPLLPERHQYPCTQKLPLGYYGSPAPSKSLKWPLHVLCSLEKVCSQHEGLALLTNSPVVSSWLRFRGKVRLLLILFTHKHSINICSVPVGIGPF